LVGEWQYHRGFIERVMVRMTDDLYEPGEPALMPEVYAAIRADFASSFARLRRLTPVRSMQLFEQGPDGESFRVIVPHLTGIRELEFFCNFGSDAVEPVVEMLNSPTLCGLISLSLIAINDSHFPASILQSILTSPILSGLTHLTLIPKHTDIGGEFIQALARSPTLANLVSLDLGAWNRIDRPTAFALATSPVLGRLTELNLRYARFDPDAWPLFLESPVWARLKRLGLYQAGVIGPAGYESDDATRPFRQSFLDRFGSTVVDFERDSWIEMWRGHSWAR
jgi:hypothetical protein